MIALLRKDVLWLLTFAGVAAFIALAIVAGLGGAEIWYRPDHDVGVGSLLFLSIAAPLLGLFSGLFEDVARTREYLVHRPVSLGRLFWTRQLGCTLVMLVWIAVVPALHLAGTLAFSEASGLVEAGRFWTFLNHGAVGFAFFGIGLFSAALVRRPALAILVAAPLTLGLLVFLALSLYGDSPSALVYHGQGAIGLAVGALLAAAALRLEREGRDLDRPAAGARLAAAAGTLVVLSLAGAAFLHLTQKDTRSDILQGYPKIAQRPDGTRLLVAQRDFKRLFPVDDSHRRIEGTAEEVEIIFEPRNLSSPRNEPFAARGKLVGGVRYERVGCGVAARCFVATDGLLHLYRIDSDGPALVVHVGKDGGGRFSPRAQLLGWWSRVALIGDPEDGGVWRYDLESSGPAFTRVVLPGDDRFVENLSGAVSRSRLATDDVSFSSYVVVRGERGVYTTGPSGFGPVPPAIARIVEQLARQPRRPKPAIDISGPVTFRATIPASGQAGATSHDYRPRTGRERALFVQMMGLSLLRAPALALASLAAARPTGLGSPSRDGARILLDPMIALGATWLLAIALLIGGVLAGLALRRLTRLGASRGRRAFWTALVFLFGPLAYLVYRACEPTRAWRPLEAAEPTPLLIQSAA